MTGAGTRTIKSNRVVLVNGVGYDRHALKALTGASDRSVRRWLRAGKVPRAHHPALGGQVLPPAFAGFAFVDGRLQDRLGRTMTAEQIEAVAHAFDHAREADREVRRLRAVIARVEQERDAWRAKAGAPQAANDE